VGKVWKLAGGGLEKHPAALQEILDKLIGSRYPRFVLLCIMYKIL
jgi:hypothetical protein